MLVYVGKEVALYCASKLGDIIKSTESYHKGDISQALRDAFMKCDEVITSPETIQEMKEMMNAEISAKTYVDLLHMYKQGRLLCSPPAACDCCILVVTCRNPQK